MTTFDVLVNCSFPHCFHLFYQEKLFLMVLTTIIHSKTTTRKQTGALSAHGSCPGSLPIAVTQSLTHLSKNNSCFPYTVVRWHPLSLKPEMFTAHLFQKRPPVPACQHQRKWFLLEYITCFGSVWKLGYRGADRGKGHLVQMTPLFSFV